jgi:hypothetical protein
MQDEPATTIGCRKNGLFLMPDNVRVTVMLWRLTDIGPAIAGA